MKLNIYSITAILSSVAMALALVHLKPILFIIAFAIWATSVKDYGKAYSKPF